MSSTSTSGAEAASRTSKPPSLVLMLMVVIVGTMLGVAAAGGAVVYLASSGKISLGGSGGSKSETKGRESLVVLEPIVANLADDGGHAFVRLGLRVELADDGGAEVGEASSGTASEAAGDKGKATSGGASSTPADGQAGPPGELESSIRDTVLTVLGRQKSTDLLGPDGKEHLKIELHEMIERGGVRVKVKDLFFTDFVVQS